MRRRLTNAHTGLGNPLPELFDNKWTDNEDFNDVVRLFFDDALDYIDDFKELGGFDLNITLREDGFRIMFGIEPSYKHDPYICYCFDSNKDNIFYKKGISNGYYGSDIVINKELRYNKCMDDFKICIDKHYDNLVKCLK